MRKTPVVAIVPAYNEATRIKSVIDRLAKYVDIIVVIDDGSTDNTAEVAIHNKTVVLKHLVNLGQGAAIQTGFEYAKTINPEVVITFDADGQFSEKEINRLIDPIIDQRVDITLGSRFLGSTVDMPIIKLMVLKIGILFTYIFSNIKLSDTHNGFRGMNKKALQLITINQNGMAHASEIIDLIKQYNLKYIEVPVTVKYDRYTKTKGQRYMNGFNIVLNLIFKKLS